MKKRIVSLLLASALLSALRGDCRLVLVGDPDQLPSVGPGNLLSDLLRSGRVPAVRLTEIFRQAQESAIVMNAHLVNQGQVPDLLDNSRDFFCLRRYDSARAVDTVVEHMEHFLSLDGERTVAMGGDLDGCYDEMPDGITGVEHIEKIYNRLLQRNYSQSLVDAIFFDNFMRVVNEVCTM